MFCGSSSANMLINWAFVTAFVAVLATAPAAVFARCLCGVYGGVCGVCTAFARHLCGVRDSICDGVCGSRRLGAYRESDGRRTFRQRFPPAPSVGIAQPSRASRLWSPRPASLASSTAPANGPYRPYRTMLSKRLTQVLRAPSRRFPRMSPCAASRACGAPRARSCAV